MIKFISFSVKVLAIASYYVRFLTQSGKFSLIFLSPYNYAKVSSNNTIYNPYCTESSTLNPLINREKRVNHKLKKT